MGYDKRKELIQELQKIRKSKIVTHINSDRRRLDSLNIPGLVTQLSTEAQPHFSKVLFDLGMHNKIDLFIHTNGGSTDSVWPLVSLFREYTDNFNVIVPYKAHSAGTLICLGANTIIISKDGELSPIDPSTGNPFNPIDEINPGKRKGISVEDVAAYFDLARNPLSKSDSTNGEPINNTLAFQILTSNVHPLALGMVNRSHKQIRDLAQRLIKTHLSVDEDKLTSVINTFTEERYSHSDIFNRKEIRELLGNEVVKYPSEKEEEIIRELFDEYIDALQLLNPFSPAVELSDTQSKKVSIIGGIIESENTSVIFKSEFILSKRSDLPKNFQIQIPPNQTLPLIPGLPEIYHINIIKMGWQINEDKL